jgi:hypothetical protein
MTPGTWQVTISAFGYTSLVQQVTIAAGSNSLPIDHLFTTPVTLNVGIQIGVGTLFACPDATPTCATVTLNRIDTGQSVSVSTADPTTHRYVFANLNPATYVVTISGEGLTQTSTQYTVPLATTKPLDVPVAVVQNTVSGIVNGPVGKNSTITAFNGVSVELGHLDSAGRFVNDKGTDGNFLILPTAANAAGIPGSYTFNNVPNGSYVARYNAGTTTPSIPVKDGYGSTVSSSFVSVTGSQSASFPTVTLDRITHSVSFVVSTTATADDVGGSTGVTLTSAADSTWTISPQPVTTTTQTPPASGSIDTWVFNAVPFGDWLLSLTLPTGHLGSLAAGTGTPSVTCTPGTSTTVAVVCTSPAASPITVPGHGSPNTGVNASYTLNEYQVGLVVLAHNLGNDPNVTPPSTVSLNVTDPASNVVYTNSTFSVSTSTPASPPGFWGHAATNYAATATTTAINWSPVGASLTPTNPSTPVALNELSTSVIVTVAFPSGTPSGVDAAIILTPPTGSGITPATTTKTVTSGGTLTATFSGLPFGVGWTATASASYIIPASTGPPAVPASTVNLSGTTSPPSFTVGTLTPPGVAVTITLA